MNTLRFLLDQALRVFPAADPPLWLLVLGILALIMLFIGQWVLGVLTALIYLYIVVRWIVRQRRREREAHVRLEHERRIQCARFGDSLLSVVPGLTSRDELHHLAWSEERIAPERFADLLLDRFDAIEGAVLGDVRMLDPAGRPVVSWPFIADHHRRRGPRGRLISASSIPLILPQELRLRGVYGIGKPGLGKTTFTRNLALQDIYAGRGVGILAAERELIVEELLPFVPEERWDDVVYVNPTDEACPVPLNPLHVEPGEDRDLKIEETITVFHRAFADGASAPRTGIILRHTIATLMTVPGTTLLDVRRLLDRTDDAYRRWAVSQVASEETRHFWTSVYTMFPTDAHVPLLTRFSAFLQPKNVQNVLCVPGACLSLRKSMDEGKILLFDLSDGILGEGSAQLLGQLVVAKLQLAALSRADTPKDRRRPFYVFIDEFQTFCGVAATSYEKLLSRARKYAIGLTLLHQQTGQISESLLHEILGNVSTIVAFRVSARDAKRIGHELMPGSGANVHLTSLAIGDAVVRLDREVHFVHTLPPPTKGSVDIRDEIIRRSRERYGVSNVAHGRRSGPPLASLDPGEVF